MKHYKITCYINDNETILLRFHERLLDTNERIEEAVKEYFEDPLVFDVKWKLTNPKSSVHNG